MTFCLSYIGGGINPLLLSGNIFLHAQRSTILLNKKECISLEIYVLFLLWTDQRPQKFKRVLSVAAY